jgi:hypothetical protein
MILDTIPAQLEVVKNDLEYLFEQTDQISSAIKKSDKVQKISRYLWRLPMKLYAGGQFSKYIGNAGSLGVGTGMKLSALQAAYFYSVLAFRVTQEQIDTSSDSSQSVVNVLSDTLANGMVEAGVLDDISFHTKGDGILTNPPSAITNTGAATITFAAPLDTLGVNRLREGMCVDAWTFDGATLRVPGTGAGTPLIITAIDYDARKVTFNTTIGSLTAGDGATTGDILAFRGMSIYGPTALTTYQAGYPGTVGASANGIGGDSFRHGFPYMTDTNGTNYFYGKQKSTVPQLLPARVNAQSTTLEWDHGHRLIAKLIQRRNPDVWKGLRGIAPMSQRATVFNLGVAISTRMFTGAEFGQSVNALPNNIGYEDTFNFCGIPCMISKRQARDRMDFLNFSKLGRAQLFDTKFFDLGNSGNMYVGRGADGTVQSYVEFFIVQAFDFVCFDSGCFGVIDNLRQPDQWDA